MPAAPRHERHRTEPFRLVSCSHMAPYKRVHLIVDAVAELERRGRKVTWTHIGEFDDERLAAMRARAEERIDSTPVTFTGHLTNTEVRELYATTDFSCFLNCSDGEGVPVAVMEAQAAGLPVVATAPGGPGRSSTTARTADSSRWRPPPSRSLTPSSPSWTSATRSTRP